MVKTSFWSLLSLGVSSHQLNVETQSMCWKKVSRRTGVMLAQNPGAGIGDIEPFDRVLKDGFFKVACVKDSMWTHGDKFGGNKHEYKLGDTANVSIVHYNDHVAKEDRELITPTTCFDFCRTIPDMGYFGIMNGRECYCEPYYNPMASDSSSCDSVCAGDKGQMCGGKSKSTIWEMHKCNDAAQALGATAFEAHTVAQALKDLIPDVMGAANSRQDLAAGFQKDFGQAGDPDAGKLMQAAKVSAGELLHLAEDAKEVMDGLVKVIDAAVSLSGLDLSGLSGAVKKGAGAQEAVVDFIKEAKAKEFENFDVAKKGDDLVKKLKDLTPKAKATLEGLQAEFTDSEQPKDAEDDHGLQYYPAMYFVDKEFVDEPMTCTGSAVGQPINSKDYHGCAAACDARNEECVGFSYFPTSGKPSLCFLFSSFKTGQYYTGCDSGPPKKGASFLQKTNVTNNHQEPLDKEPTHPVCLAKLSKFSGTTLKPDPEGKCKQCLRELTKANRCWK